LLDTYTTIWNKVLLRAPAVPSLLSRDWVTNAFREVAERRRWSWLVKSGQIIVPDSYNTGTVSATLGSPTITGAGTTWTPQMVGRQFRVGASAPIYTIAGFNSATSLTLDAVWGGSSVSSSGYEIYQCFFPVPDDFHAYMTLWDPAMNWRLWLNIQQDELNQVDAQRSNRGQSYLISFRDYSTIQNGTVNAPLQVLGSGPSPISGGVYTGVADAIFTVEITTGGASGTAVFQWKKDNGSWTTVTTDSGGFSQDLQDGVSIAFPVGPVYVLNDLWVVRTRAIAAVGVPRYELWPHRTSAYVFPYLYESRAQDLQDPGATLPRYIRGDVLLEMVLAEAAGWPGTSANQPNVYYNPVTQARHGSRAEKMIGELERQDDETSEIDLTWPAMGLPLAPWPLGDSRWLQSHAV